MSDATWAGGVVLILVGVAIVARTIKGTGTAGGSHLIATLRRAV